MTINGISTRMHYLAMECGGDHHTGKEIEAILEELADNLDKIAMDMAVETETHFTKVKRWTGISDSNIYDYKYNESFKRLNPGYNKKENADEID